ncbi:myoD family inhibitor isoform X1 [Coregonus clupeaformis]|uniref:myoD family inhibitor isoform X1 n=1 Tax=Coregonus clupeaformis TaxID=59861 RepID=UPI001E1C4A84|nr:myoD family inhibitor isoform X1 [Coregonus clupeaformis]
MELLPQGRTGETVISQDTVKGQEVAKCPLDLPEYQTTQPQPQPHPPPNVITQQPLFNGTAGEHTAELPGPSVRSDRADDEDSDDSMTDLSTTDDVSHLLPNRVPTNPYQLQKVEPPTGVPLSSSPKTSPKTLTNGASPSPVCTPPSASNNQRGWSPPQPPQPPACNRHHGHPDKKQHLPSTTKSQNSLKADATQIKEIAGDDCCVHCVLACLFCEVLSLCSVVAQCLACGEGCEVMCCCGEGAAGGLACGEDACSALLDCGILEDCCESSDCLEICLECCSICFPV